MYTRARARARVESCERSEGLLDLAFATPERERFADVDGPWLDGLPPDGTSTDIASVIFRWASICELRAREDRASDRDSEVSSFVLNPASSSSEEF